MNTNQTIVAVDFDGTIVEHKYPLIGDPVPGAIETMKELTAKGHKIILWTMRSGKELQQAVNYCIENGIHFYGVNRNPHQSWSTSPKAYAHYYVDDAAIGMHLLPTDDRPIVNWSYVHNFFKEQNIL